MREHLRVDCMDVMKVFFPRMIDYDSICASCSKPGHRGLSDPSSDHETLNALSLSRFDSIADETHSVPPTSRGMIWNEAVTLQDHDILQGKAPENHRTLLQAPNLYHMDKKRRD